MPNQVFLDRPMVVEAVLGPADAYAKRLLDGPTVTGGGLTLGMLAAAKATADRIKN